MLTLLSDYCQAFIHLFFPNICCGCGIKPPLKNDLFCLSCQLDLPFTDHYKIKDNQLEMKVKGRFKIDRGAAYFYFRKGGKVQELIHKIKYQNKPQIARALGRKFGQQLLESDNFQIPDVLIPIPLHFKKFRHRGYNQSTEYAKGIQEVIGCQLSTNLLTKPLPTPSQTDKSRLGRIKSVGNTFKMIGLEELANKKVLLIDDVITTGATLEAAAEKLLQAKNLSLSLACVAMAEIQ